LTGWESGSESGAWSARIGTRDRDALDTVARSVFPHSHTVLDSLDPDEPFEMWHESAGDARFSFQRMGITSGATSTASVGPLIVVARAPRAHYEMRVGRTEFDTTRPFMLPPGEFEARWQAVDELTAVAVLPDSLAQAARALTSDDRHRLRFTASAPVSEAAARFWDVIVDELAALTRDPVMLENPIVRGEAYRSAVRAILLSFANTALAAAAPETSAPPPRVVDAAVAFIEAHAQRDLGLLDIAAAVGATPRALTAGFHRRHDMTPLQYLRMVRFERVRQELLEADPWGPTTVRDAALRWGFAAPGRFAGEYRRRFGETPSQTLRR
jgi:AraC-like DNA-binding protein